MDSIKALLHGRRVNRDSLDRERKAFKESWPEFRFRDVEITGLNERQQQYVEQSFRKSDSIVGIEDVRKEYLKLANDKSLIYLYPKAVYDPEDSLYTLKMRVIPEAPLEARFGLFISTTGLAQTFLGFSFRQIQEVSTHLKGSLQFGRLYDGVNLGFRFDYPSRTPIFFQGDFNYNRFDYNASNPNFFFEDLKPSFIIENEINFRFDVGLPYSVNSILKAGVGIGRNQEIYYMTKDFTTSDTSEVSRSNLVSLYGALERNTLNNKQFSVAGDALKLSLRVGYGNEVYDPGSTSGLVTGKRKSYYWLSARFENTGYVPIASSFSLGYHYLLQATFKPLLSNYYSTIIEAPVFQPNLVTRGLFMERYRAHQFIGAGIMPVWAFSRQVHAKLEAYAFIPVQEILRDDMNLAQLGNYFQGFHSIFNASLNVVTVAGPIGIHAAYLSAQESPWVFQLSFGYLLFNKKSNED
jgi:NTE family protein